MAGIVTAGIIGGVGSIASGIFGASSAKKREAAARKERRRLTKKLQNLEDNRQEIINPYEDMTSLSGMMSNPMANLSVATQATDIQIEQTDIALANTLDTLRESGGGAGGATALAQAALQSKKNVAADIESQEKSNEDKRAAGEQKLQQAQIAEAERMQDADAMGKKFVYGETEDREMQQLNRLQNQIDQQQGIKAQASADQTSALTGAISGVAGGPDGPARACR